MRKILHPSAVRLAAAVALAATWTACQDESFTFSTYRNNLTIDNSIHQDPVLAGAITHSQRASSAASLFHRKPVSRSSSSRITTATVPKNLSMPSTKDCKARTIWA